MINPKTILGEWVTTLRTLPNLVAAIGDGSRIQYYTENATVFGQQISMVLTGGKRLLEFRQSRAYLVHNLAGVNAGNRIASVKIGFWPKHTAPTPRATINMVFAAVRSP